MSLCDPCVPPLQVDRLGASLSVSGDVGYTCETAINFFKFHVAPKVADFLRKCEEHGVSGAPDASFVWAQFPFGEYFSTAPGGLTALFKQASFAEDFAAAQGCLRHLDNMLGDVERCACYSQWGCVLCVRVCVCVCVCARVFAL